jgi:hypothetical protein
MSTPLLPQSFWFRLAIPCTRVDDLPRAKSATLLGLPETCGLPETSRLDGKEPWADVRVAWNPQGLGVEVTAQGDLNLLDAPEQPDGLYGVRVWVDTRDTRNVSRATRFCHRFDCRLRRGKTRTGLEVDAQQRAIARAVGDAPLCRPGDFQTRAERLKGRWRLELFLPAAVLHGFDPETNRRLGFSYQVSDPERDDQFLGVGREFPVGENPSLWATLELRDA